MMMDSIFLVYSSTQYLQYNRSFRRLSTVHFLHKSSHPTLSPTYPPPQARNPIVVLFPILRIFPLPARLKSLPYLRQNAPWSVDICTVLPICS